MIHRTWHGILSGLVFAVALMTLSCDFLSPTTGGTEKKTLYVKFINESTQFTITDIHLLPMGSASSEDTTPKGEWGPTILADGAEIAPGAHHYFTLEIPNLHYCRYRLGVRDEQGNRILLHEQPGYGDGFLTGTITHWGSHERTVSVTVVRDQVSRLIVVTGYSDFAGIE